MEFMLKTIKDKVYSNDLKKYKSNVYLFLKITCQMIILINQ